MQFIFKYAVILSFVLIQTIVIAKLNEEHNKIDTNVNILNHSTNKNDFHLLNEEEILRKEKATVSSIFKFGVNGNAFNELIPPLGELVFPLLKEYVDGSIFLEVEESTGSCCNFGDFGGRIKIIVDGFNMDPIDANKITIDPIVGPSPNNSFRLRVRSGELKARFAEVGFAVGLAALFPVTCDISGSVEVSISSIILEYDVISAPSQNSTVFISKSSEMRIENFDIDIQRNYLGGSCGDDVSGIIDGIFDLIQGSIEILFELAINVELIQFPDDIIPKSEFEIPQLEPLKVFENNTLDVKHTIPSMFLADDSIIISPSIDLEATLATPSWRNGSRFSETFITGELTDPTSFKFANANIGSDGVNNLVSVLWYLLWSTLANDEDAINSVLCKPSENDPCPLPPLTDEFDLSGDKYWFLFPFGNARVFKVRYVLEAPLLEFANDDLIYGKAKGRVKVDGLSFFGLELDVLTDLDFVGTSLEYNSTTGRYSGLHLQSVSFTNLEIEDANRPIICFGIASFVLPFLERLLNQFVTGGIMDSLNQSLDAAIKSIPDIPVIPNFPTAETSMMINLTQASMSGRSGGNGFQSIASLSANIVVTIFESSTSNVTKSILAKKKESKLRSRNDRSNVDEALAAVVQKWMEESNGNPNAYYSWYYHNEDTNSTDYDSYTHDDFS